MWCKFDQGGGSKSSGPPAPVKLTLNLEGSVGSGGQNRKPDVLAIQRALNLIGMANPPLKVDGIYGPKTLAAINNFQKLQFHGEIADGRIDPGKRSLARLGQLVSSDGPVTSGNKLGITTASTSNDQMDLARKLALDAEDRINRASQRLGRTLLALAKSSRNAQENELIREVNWHFKANLADDPTAHLLRVGAVYTFMLTAVRGSNNGSREIFKAGEHEDPTAIAAAPLGGFFSFIEDERFIIITPIFRTQSSAVIVHELAHFCGGNKSSGNDIVHMASPLEPPRGERRQDGNSDYAGMTAFQARINVFSYQVYCFPDRREFKVPPEFPAF